MPRSNAPSVAAHLISMALMASLLCATTSAQAQRVPASAAQSPTEILSSARRALQAGEHQKAADLLADLLASDSSVAHGARTLDKLDKADRAEAWRVYGLALYFLERYEPARLALFEYLKLDYDARLDPSLWPPEVVAFFEDVRARNAAELMRYRPKPKKRRSRMLNLVPPLGQFQNGHRTKGVIISSVGLLALAGNISSFVLLSRWCDPTTVVCESETGESREGQARIMRTVNLISSVVLAGVLAYGIIDGFVHDRREPRRITVGWLPLQRGLGVALGGRF